VYGERCRFIHPAEGRDGGFVLEYMRHHSITVLMPNVPVVQRVPATVTVIAAAATVVQAPVAPTRTHSRSSSVDTEADFDGLARSIADAAIVDHPYKNTYCVSPPPSTKGSSVASSPDRLPVFAEMSAFAEGDLVLPPSAISATAGLFAAPGTPLM
jgi:hypothetical protein